MPEGEDSQRPGPRLVANRYVLLSELGRGSMGVVRLAEDRSTGRQLAVKELRPPPGLPGPQLAAFRARALREAQSAAVLRHPGAVTLYDVLPPASDDSTVYLLMELIEGPTLGQLIQSQGRLPDAVVAGYGLQLLDVLAAAHALGVVHRDIKPANIMIAPDGRVKLADFGVAHILGDARLTRSGVRSTSAYMAPELFDAAPITPAADLWSLGATLYAAAEGYGPFDRDTTAATLRAILLEDVPTPRCSPSLTAAITGLLRRDPARRATVGQAWGQLRQAAGEALVPAQPTADSTTAHGLPAGHLLTPWEQADTGLSPFVPPVPDAAPPARESARTAGTGPRRTRLMVAFAAAVVIAIAGGATGAVLATRHGPASAQGGSGATGGGSASSGGAVNVALKPRATLTDQGNGSAAKIAFSANSALVATSDDVNPAVLWNATSGSKISSVGEFDGFFVAFSPDGRTLALPSGENYIELWNATPSSPAGSIGNPSVEQLGAAFSPDGSTLAAASKQGVQLFNIASHQLITTLGPSDAVSTVAFSPNGKLLAAGYTATGEVYVWNAASRGLIATLAPPVTGEYYGPGSWLAFSPDSGTLAIASDTPKAPDIRFWDVASNTWGATLTDPGSQGVGGLAFSPDGRVLAAGDMNGSAYLWDLATRKLIATQHVNSSGVADVTFSPDGRTFAGSDYASHIYLWNVIES